MKPLVVAVALMLAGAEEDALAQVESQAMAGDTPHVAAIRAGKLAVGMTREDARLALRARRLHLGAEPDDLDTVRMTRRRSSADPGVEDLWTYSEPANEVERLVVFRNDVITWIGAPADYQRSVEEAQRARQQAADAAFLAAHGPETWSKEGYQEARWGMPRGEVARLIPSAGQTRDENGVELARDTLSLLDRDFARAFVYEGGLLKEVGLFLLNVTARDGALFGELRAALTKKYGKPSSTEDGVAARGSIWKLKETVIVIGFVPFETQVGRIFIRYVEAKRYEAEQERDAARRRALEKQL